MAQAMGARLAVSLVFVFVFAVTLSEPAGGDVAQATGAPGSRFRCDQRLTRW